MVDSVSSSLANIVGWLIQKIFESLLAPFADIYKVDELIFGTFESEETIYWRTFTESELANAFLPAYYLMLTVAGTMLVIFIILAGIRIAGASISASKRNELMEFTKELVLVGIGIYMLPEFYSFLFAINNIFVDLFSKAIGTDIFALNQTIEQKDSLGSSETGIIGKVIINLILVGIGIWANFYYLMRKITLLILMPLGPVMLVCWMFPAWKGVTLTYLRELSGTIFIQAIHAFTFWTVANVSNAETGLIATIIGYIIFIPISEQIRGLLGLSTNMQGSLNKAGAMMGMSAAAGVFGSVKGALSGNGVIDSLKNGGKQLMKDMKDGKGAGQALKDMAGTAKEAAFASAKAMDMEKFGDLVSKGGKAVGGMSGSFVGSPMGPMAAIGMAEVLSKGGGLAGGVAGRAGYAAQDKLKSMIGDGKQALEDKENFDEVSEFAKAVGSSQAASWAEGSKGKMMSDLRSKFPTASDAELTSKFNQMVGQKAKDMTADSEQLLTGALNHANGKGDSTALVAAGATSMANAWENKNSKDFLDNWKSANPKGANESTTAYEKRANEALLSEKSHMFDNFTKDGEAFVRDNADSLGRVNRDGLASHMSSAALNHKGIGNLKSTELLGQAKAGMEGVSGLNILKPGQTNANDLIVNMAEAKTEQAGKARVQELMATQGISQSAAQAIWKNERPQELAKNMATFDTPEFKNSIGQAATLTDKKSALIASGSNVGTFVQGAIAKDAKNISQSMQALKETVNVGASTLASDVASGKNIFQSIGNAKSAASQTMSNKILENFNGDAVQAQQSIVQGAGYALGVIGGAGARVGAQNLALKALHGSTIGQATQSQISNASEILQMAHKVPDDNGGMRVADGAIRQVTTRDKSFIEVRTASGEIKTVSRIGAGSESLRNGETVYQDLTSTDGKSLEIASVGRSGVSTYRMDTGGGRIPVAQDVQNPMSLIGNMGGSHAEVNQGYRSVPVLNGKIDSGKFYREDLGKTITSNGISGVQVVTSKAEQYLVGTNAEGQQVRLSPIMQGDARLGANQTIATPVSVSSRGEIIASKVQMGSSGTIQGLASRVTTNEQVQGNVEIVESIVNSAGQPSQRVTVQRETLVSNPNAKGVTVQNVNRVIANGADDSFGYVMPHNLAAENVTTFNNLLTSKHEERVQRGLNKRFVADQIRAKQGRP